MTKDSKNRYMSQRISKKFKNKNKKWKGTCYCGYNHMCPNSGLKTYVRKAIRLNARHKYTQR